jgi:DNA polymerase
LTDILKTDFETRSYVEIGGADGVGLFNYFNHPSTSILMQAYKLPGEDGPCKHLWELHKGPMPKELNEALVDPSIFVESFNSAFERHGLKKLGYDIPPERFIDPQVAGRYLCLPPDLESMCTILDVPEHLAKDKNGSVLINLFSVPVVERKTKKNPNPRTYFNDWNSHPAEWELFGKYCMRDVDAEEELLRREEILGAWPMSDFERRVWCFDQRVNDRGLPVDLEFVNALYWVASEAKRIALEEQNAITKLENSNSTAQLLPWVRERGYPYNTLNKAFVEAALNDPQYVMSEECHTVLTKRLSAGSTSYTKLDAVKRHICPDGVIRNMFIYLGSSRCGRWAGNAVQPHNFPRPSPPKKVNGADFEDLDTLNEARRMVYRCDYKGILNKYGNVLEVVKSLMRTIFVAPGSERII